MLGTQHLASRQVFGAFARGAMLSRSSQMVRSSATLQSRNISMDHMTEQQNLDLLQSQRKIRPSSPHFTIYKWQWTWIPSIMNRMTGGGLSAAMYVGALGYLAAPTVFDSGTMTATVASLPEVVKVAGKLTIGFSALFHSINGIRHLYWDTANGYKLKTIDRGAQLVIGSSALGAIGLLYV